MLSLNHYEEADSTIKDVQVTGKEKLFEKRPFNYDLIALAETTTMDHNVRKA